MENILALSSSRVGNGNFLEAALPLLKEIISTSVQKLVFVPFAAADRNYAAYGQRVNEALKGIGVEVETLTPQTAAHTIQQANLVLVGGGNTFKLLHDLYDLNLLELIREKVKNGTPYIGWSAGANLVGATICTTNDMPVIEPQSFRALGFFPFQINPHYYNISVPGFNGETRDQRLSEFVLLNPTVPVVGLPEGSALRYFNSRLTYLGGAPGSMFSAGGHQPVVREDIEPGADLTHLLPAPPAGPR
jgi:dipeptidase E